MLYYKLANNLVRILDGGRALPTNVSAANASASVIYSHSLSTRQPTAMGPKPKFKLRTLPAALYRAAARAGAAPPL